MGVRKNPNGTYTAIYYEKVSGVTRPREREKTFMTQKLAEDFIDARRLAIERGEVYGTSGDNVLISDVIDYYRRHKKKSPRSLELDKIVIKRWENWFKKNSIVFVADIKKDTIKRFESERLKERASKNRTITQRTANIDINVLSAILNYAWKFDLIKSNPIFKYPLEQADKRIARWLDIDEITRILKFAKQNDKVVHDLIYCYLTLGFREEEALFLQFSDYRDGHIHFPSRPVKRNDPAKHVWIMEGNKRSEFSWAPKWNKERRIYLDENYADDPYLVKILEKKKGSKDYVFPSDQFTDGRPILRRSVHRRIKKIYEDAGIRNFDELNVHSLRHTHISYMVARVGLDRRITLPVIMENVGIRDFDTLQRYVKAVKNLAKNLPDPTRLPWQIS